MRRTVLRLFTYLITSVPVVAIAQQTSGNVQGYVYTANGQRLSGALVSIFPTYQAVGGALPSAITDEDGHYSITTTLFGRLRISASKESEGVPEATFGIFVPSGEKPTLVELTPEKPTAIADIHLPPRSCIVRGTVVDSITRKPIPKARLVIRKAQAPETFLSTSFNRRGEFDFLLPQEPITLVVIAAGYRMWTYKGTSGESTVTPNCRLETAVLIELKPL